MAKLSGKEVYPFYFGAKPEILRVAASLRLSMTESEKILWQKLKSRKLSGYRFRRQHPINEFIVDFFCYDAMLAIEVDGDVHNDRTQNERDDERTKILNRFGIKVIRFTNDDVESNINGVLDQIKINITNQKKK
jgi:very-short-patch-repair endonuclease